MILVMRKIIEQRELYSGVGVFKAWKDMHLPAVNTFYTRIEMQ